jgi:hypothetical protein
MGNGTCDLPSCSIVPQATTLPRAPELIAVISLNNINRMHRFVSVMLAVCFLRCMSLTLGFKTSLLITGKGPTRVGSNLC